jgi:A/G-specific adenine glycosylase
LPWRGERDPYRILVSEVMLQQTQALRVAPLYEAFIERFPTVFDLARASSADVLRAWQNLGYNRRALNLWRSARTVADAGGFPETVDGLEALPGVGRYTARAVASFAFGVDAGVVDANVRRLLTRYGGLRPDSDVQETADDLVPPGRAAEWNQAMIDLGAEVCRAREAKCADCPLARGCAWNRGIRIAPAKRKGHVPFAGTTRYARGRVIEVLREADGPLSRAEIVRRSGLDRRRVDGSVTTLERDGLVTVRRYSVLLGSSAPSRADVRRR